ncbi:ORF124 [Ranid herpesvirus 2]|uniref:ORF124 n=1 Tax=Ranid herpesvirus 2 TaxID=389214 RepID=Q14VY2_9VIRU|nr:ORF124 [Ranid herpesvirus 2]ABG25575.1 ORF124 [Ranid herpesvirus 2]
MASYTVPSSFTPKIAGEVLELIDETTFAVFLNDVKVPVGIEYLDDFRPHSCRGTTSKRVYLKSDHLLVGKKIVAQIPQQFGYEALAFSDLRVCVTDDEHFAGVRDLLMNEREWAHQCAVSWLEPTIEEQTNMGSAVPIIFISQRCGCPHQIRHAMFYLLNARKCTHTISLDLSLVSKPEWRNAALECILTLCIKEKLKVSAYISDAGVLPSAYYNYSPVDSKAQLVLPNQEHQSSILPFLLHNPKPLVYKELLGYGMVLEFEGSTLVTRKACNTCYLMPYDGWPHHRYTLTESRRVLYSKTSGVRMVVCTQDGPPKVGLKHCLVCYPSNENYVVYTDPLKYMTYYKSTGRMTHHTACALTAHVDHMRTHKECKAALVYAHSHDDLLTLYCLAEIWMLQSVTVVLVGHKLPNDMLYTYYLRALDEFPSCLEMTDRSELDAASGGTTASILHHWKTLSVTKEEFGNVHVAECTENHSLTPLIWSRNRVQAEFFRMVRCISTHRIGMSEEGLSFSKPRTPAQRGGQFPQMDPQVNYAKGYAGQNSRPPKENRPLGSLKIVTEDVFYKQILREENVCGLMPELIRRAVEFYGAEMKPNTKMSAEFLESLDADAKLPLRQDPHYYQSMRKTATAPCGNLDAYDRFVERHLLAPLEAKPTFAYTPLEDMLFAAWTLRHCNSKPLFTDLGRISDLVEFFYSVEEPCIEDLRQGSLISKCRLKPFRYKTTCESKGDVTLSITAYLLQTTAMFREHKCILLHRERGSVAAAYATDTYFKYELEEMRDFLCLVSQQENVNFMLDVIAPLFGALFVRQTPMGVYRVERYVAQPSERRPPMFVNGEAVFVHSGVPVVYDLDAKCVMVYTTCFAPVLLPQWQTTAPVCNLHFCSYRPAQWKQAQPPMELNDKVYDFAFPTRGDQNNKCPNYFMRQLPALEPVPAPLRVEIEKERRLLFKGKAEIFLDMLQLQTDEHLKAFVERGASVQSSFHYPRHLENMYGRILNEDQVWSCGTFVWKIKPLAKYQRYLQPVLTDMPYAHLYVCDGRTEEEIRLRKYVIAFLGGTGTEAFLLDAQRSLGYAHDMGSLVVALLYLLLSNREIFIRLPSPRLAVELHELLPTIAFVAGPMPRRIKIYSDAPVKTSNLPTVLRGVQEDQKVVIYYTEHLKVPLTETDMIRYIFGVPKSGDFCLSTTAAMNRNVKCNYIVLLGEGEAMPSTKNLTVVAYVKPTEMPFMEAHINAIRHFGKISQQLLYVAALDPRNPTLKYKNDCWFHPMRRGALLTPEQEYKDCLAASQAFTLQMPEDQTVKIACVNPPVIGQSPTGFHTFEYLADRLRVKCTLPTSVEVHVNSVLPVYNITHTDITLEQHKPGDRVYAPGVYLSSDAGVEGFIYNTLGVYVLDQSYSDTTHYADEFLIFQYAASAGPPNTAKIFNCNPARRLVSCKVYGTGQQIMAGAITVAQYYGFSKLRIFAIDDVQLLEWAHVLRKLHDQAAVYCLPWSVTVTTLCVADADAAAVKDIFLSARLLDHHFIEPALKQGTKNPKAPSPGSVGVAEPGDQAFTVISLYINTKLQHAYVKSKSVVLGALLNRHKEEKDWIVYAYLVTDQWVFSDGQPPDEAKDRIFYLLKWYQVSKWLCCSVAYSIVPTPVANNRP